MKNKVKKSKGYLIRKMHVNLTAKPSPVYFKVTSIVDNAINGSYSEDSTDLKLMGIHEAVKYNEMINEANPTDDYEVVMVKRAKHGERTVDSITRLGSLILDLIG